MSMRTTLSGCTLSKVRKAIGRADEKLIETVQKRLEKEAREFERDDDEEAAQQVREQAASIVAKLRGQDGPTLEDEGHAGYVVAKALLARFDGSKRPRTGFEVKSAFWYEVLDYYGEELGEEAALFGHLASGRPLFGRTINNGCFYAWFDRAEAVRLRDAALRIGELWREKAHRREPPLRLDTEAVELLTGERDGLAGCVDQILAAGYDVWAETT